MLILGERGTGKQVVAEAIWRLYHREKNKALTTFDCGAFSETLLLSELFGHKKGAFTGATEDHTGLLKQCDNRMLFLEKWIQKLCRRFEGGELSLKDLPVKFISSIMRDEEMYELPDLPLPISLKDYIDKIRERARLQAGGNMAEVDRLLGQNPGTEKQRQYRQKQK